MTKCHVCHMVRIVWGCSASSLCSSRNTNQRPRASWVAPGYRESATTSCSAHSAAQECVDRQTHMYSAEAHTHMDQLKKQTYENCRGATLVTSYCSPNGSNGLLKINGFCFSESAELSKK